MIKEIKILSNNDVFSNYINESGGFKRLPLKKVNIFVGENNSGKSRFLRELFLTFRYKEVNNTEYYDFINFPFISSETVQNEFDKLSKSYLSITLGDANKKKLHLKKISNTLLPDSINSYYSFNKYSELFKDFTFRQDGPVDVLKHHNDYFDKFYERRKNELENFSYSTYIPVLRTLRKFPGNIDEPIKTRIYEDYFKRISKDVNIFTGEDLYNEIRDLRDSGEDEREKLINFQNFLSTNFFNNPVEIVPRRILGKHKDGKHKENSNNDLYIKIGKENEYPFHLIGDGIKALILLTFPIFLHQDKNHMLFIDEPELNLHPGMQRIFLDVISSDEFSNTQVFLTTHSNHFLDLAIESSNKIEIFSFRKEIKEKNAKFNIQNITQTAYDALDLLGVRTSSVFLSNCTIWIEGISERIYFRHYLKLYTKYLLENETGKDALIFKEDIHYSYVEYSGNNIKHWSFFENNDNDCKNINYESISRNVLVISDNDNKAEKHKMLKEKLGENYYSLECNEVENLLLPEILKSTVLDFKYKKVKEINDDIFEVGEYDKYQSEPIGEYIYNVFIKDKEFIKESILSTPSKKSTRKIIDKKTFSINAIKNIKIWDDLSNEAQNLTKLIYEFIKKNNI